MSWSISFRGKPAEIAADLEKHSGSLTGQSKIEFDDALPHLVGLVKQTFENRPGRETPTLAITAHGSGSSDGDAQFERDCSVNIARAQA